MNRFCDLRHSVTTPWLSRLVVTAVLFGAVACGGDSTSPEAVTTGRLVLMTSGLPASLRPSFTIVDAGGARAVSGTDTVRNLQPGVVTITPGEPSAAGVGRYRASSQSYTATVRIGETSSQAVSYSAAPIVFLPTVEGLPPGSVAALRLNGPDGGLYAALSGASFTTSLVGTWAIVGEPLSASNFWWTPTTPSISRNVLPGDTVAITVPFTVASGAINVAAIGLSELVAPTITVSNGTRTFTRVGLGAIPDVPPGTWQITATSATASGLRYSPAVSPTVVEVALGELADARIPFVSEPVLANFSVEGAYLTQAVQTFDGNAPLVAGRDALLRVFARATDLNNWRPPMRVTLFANGTPLETLNVAYGSASIDTVLSEGVLARSWNVRVPGALIVPGLSLLVQADPDRTVAVDGDPDDNVWPRGGIPRAVNVARMNPWRVVLVPVTNAPTGLTGGVTESNKNEYLELARQLLPVGSVEARVRAVFTSSVDTLSSGDGNNAWTRLLSEMNALRAAEGVPGEYWYGVVKVNYSSGIAGYGYVPGRTAVGWDYLPSGGRVAAHEWGHNMSRPHAPCGSVASADASFPHAGGVIGSWGWNANSNTLVSPTATDLMGYCGNQWISAYNWTRMFDYRASSSTAMIAPSVAAAGNAGTERLLVWGSITGGGVQVEPAFLVSGTGGAEEPIRDGERVVNIELLDASGRVLVSKLAAAPPIDHVSDGSRAFAATIPLSSVQAAQIANIRVRDVRSALAVGSRQRSVQSAVAAAQGRQASSALRATREGAGRLRLEWDVAAYPRVMVRDATSGRIIGFARRPGAIVSGAQGDVEIVLSDGVRSRVERPDAIR